MRSDTLDASMPMEISQSRVAGGPAVVTLRGKLMMGTDTDQIVSTVEGLLREGVRTIIFDLSGVTVIDSTGVGRFISSFNKIMAAGGEMRMAAATGHVFQTFHVSLLDTVFPFYDSVEAATR